MYHNKTKLSVVLHEGLEDVVLGDADDQFPPAIDDLLTPRQRYYLIMNIMRCLPKSSLEMVKEFSEAFDLPKEKGTNVEEFKTAELRFSLILEETIELGFALGISLGTMYSIFTKLFTKVKADPPKPGLDEVLDALTDLDYVVQGAFWTFDLEDIAFEAMEEVHNSNMSKLLPADVDLDILTTCVAQLQEHGYKVRSHRTPDGRVVLLNVETNKVLKPYTYVKADLKRVIVEYLKSKNES